MRDSAPTLTTTYNFKTTTYFLEESLSSRGPHRVGSKAEMIERLQADDQKYKYTPAALPQFVQRLDDYLHQTNDQSPRPARVLDKQLLVAAQPTRRYDQLKVNMPTFSPFGGQISVNEKAPLQQYDGLNVAMPSASRIHSSAAPVVEVAPRYNGLNFDVPTLSLFRSPTYPATKAAPTGSDHMNSSMSTFNVLSKLTSQLNGQTSTTKGPKYTCPGHRDPSKTPTRAPMVPTSATSSSSTLLKNDFESETNFEVYVPLCPYRLTQPPSAIPPTALRHRPSDLEGENKLDLYPIGRMRIRKRPSPSSCTDQSEPALKRRCPKENQSNRSYLQQIAEETNQQLSCTPLPSGRTPLPSGRNPLSFGCTPVPSGRTPMPSGRTSLPMGEENLAQTGSFLNSWNVRQPWNISPNNLNLSNAAGASRGDSGVNDSGYNNVGVFELVEFLPQKVHDEVFAHHLQLAPPSNLVNWLTRGLIPKQVLDEVVAQHLRTAPAKDIVNWLARAGRLGFTEKDMVDEDLDAILHADDGLHVNENPTVDGMHRLSEL